MKHILIVDDEAHVIRILRMALEQAGYQVDDASNGEQALEFLEKRHPDVMITDIDMPRMNGKELCLEVSRTYPDRTFSVFVLTARAELEHRDWASKLPKLEFMEKPVSIHKLLSHLAAHFESEVTSEEPGCQSAH